MTIPREQVSAKLAEILGENPESLAASNVDNAHNIRESWNATVDRIMEFQSKYVDLDDKDGGGQAQQQS